MMRSTRRRRTTSATRASASSTTGCSHERGQAALALVLALAMMMVTAGAALAVNAQAHDPLVEADAAEHYAYRALESGIDSYLSTVNARPDLVDCSSQSTATTCTSTSGIRYDTWTQVPQTTRSAGNVPEYYLWTNPQLCFSTTRTTKTRCTALPTASDGNFEYLKVKIIGAAGYPGDFFYQSSVVDFQAAQGFLTRVWWSNYESTDKAVVATPKKANPTLYCKYNWQTKKKTATYAPTTTTKTRSKAAAYQGKDGTCGTIVFADKTVVDGPVFSNDSIYVTSKPVFGTHTDTAVNSPVTTADPKCLFVTDTKGDTACTTVPKNDVTRYTKSNSHPDEAVEPIPTSDSSLLAVAQVEGCAYLGPTTISLYATGGKQYMNVTSPETPVKTTHDEENDTGNTNVCVGSHIEAPTTANKGNGVIFVTTSTVGTGGVGTCTGNGDNPFDGTIQHKRNSKVSTWATVKHPGTIKAQVVAEGALPGTSTGYVYPDGETAKEDDCEGDVFVRDSDSSNTPTGATPGIAGNLTIAAGHDVIITGDLEYTDCGPTFKAGVYAGGDKKTCKYTPRSVNDSLGLIATDYVEVNRPANPSCVHPKVNDKTTDTKAECKTATKTKTKTKQPTSILKNCKTTPTVSDLTAVLCNPGPTLVIDAAVLALKHSFAVNDIVFTYGQTTKTTDYPGTTTDKLSVYGSIDQDWRGVVGEAGGSHGYVKHYVWDSRLQYVTIPHYLEPATPSWDLASSSVQLSTGCPGWPKPYPTGSTPTASKADFPAATTKGPTGASGAC